MIWERAAGVCVLCQRRIDGVRERWIVEHIRALELGGVDDLSNMAPAHEACALAKTRDDHRRAARAKRKKIRHIGADAPKRALPFGRRSRWKRTLSGKIVPR
jgi:5-methylcytosine-specific restriction endonuclease McrA